MRLLTTVGTTRRDATMHAATIATRPDLTPPALAGRRGSIFRQSRTNAGSNQGLTTTFTEHEQNRGVVPIRRFNAVMQSSFQDADFWTPATRARLGAIGCCNPRGGPFGRARGDFHSWDHKAESFPKARITLRSYPGVWRKRQLINRAAGLSRRSRSCGETVPAAGGVGR